MLLLLVAIASVVIADRLRGDEEVTIASLGSSQAAALNSLPAEPLTSEGHATELAPPGGESKASSGCLPGETPVSGSFTKAFPASSGEIEALNTPRTGY